MKKLASILIALCVICTCASCASKSVMEPGLYLQNSASSNGTAPAAPQASSMPEADYGYDDAVYDKEMNGEFAIVRTSAETPESSTNFSEKIIYSASADIETIDFDTTIDNVYEMLNMYGAFVETSYIGGMDYAQKYYGYQSYRSAQFTLRVPVTAYTSMTESLGVLGNVTSLRSSAENITAQFTDTQSRLTTYRTEETRLLAMLEKADTVADMIIIEEHLSNVRYQIESLTSTLKNWQNQVDYSTVSLYIREVQKLSDNTPIQRSYWGQIGEGIKSTLGGIGEFGKGSLKWLIIASPVLLILAVAGVVTLIVLKKKKHTKVELPKGDE